MRYSKQITAIILAGALLSTSIGTIPAAAATFSDVLKGHWAYDVVNVVSNEKIMVGMADGVFSPDTTLTRAQYTAILCNLAPDKANGYEYAPSLSDVPENAWYRDVAEWGVTNGIIREINGRFEGDAAISRELMAFMTKSFLSKYYWDTFEYDYASAGYADESEISSDYVKSVNLLTNIGLLAGRGNNNFEPIATLTRAEAAAMATRLLGMAEKSEINWSEDPSEPEQPPTETEDPVKPPEEEQPPVNPVEPEEPSEEDPSGPIMHPQDPTEPAEDPSTWDRDGAPEWFFVGKPDNFSWDQWYEIIEFWSDKESLAHSNTGFPVELPSWVTTEKEAKKELQMYFNRLYDEMLAIKEDEQLEEQFINTLESGTCDFSEDEQKMLELVNEARAAQGLNTLKISPALCNAAETRAREIQELFEHKRPDGREIATVLNEVGLSQYNLTKYGGTAIAYDHYIGLGENILKGGRYINLDKNCIETPEDAFDSWWNSPGHKANMLNKTYEYIGIAHYNNGRQSFWVQLFCDAR